MYVSLQLALSTSDSRSNDSGDGVSNHTVMMPSSSSASNGVLNSSDSTTSMPDTIRTPQSSDINASNSASLPHESQSILETY